MSRIPGGDELRRRLTPEQFHVTQERGTERAFTGRYWEHERKGVYECVCGGQPLFRLESKSESGSGWPSFLAPPTD